MRRFGSVCGLASLLLIAWSVMLIGCDDDMCVAEGSSILTPGGHVNVETLEVGDVVYSIDLDSGELVPALIGRIGTATDETVEVFDDRGHFIRLTRSHPVLTSSRDRYVKIGDLIDSHAPTVAIRDKSGDISSTTVAWTRSSEPVRVYDISVESNYHNFVAGGFIVHNKQPHPITPEAITDLAVAQVTMNSATITWTKPRASWSFDVLLDGDPVDSIDATGQPEGSAQSYTITNLDPDTEYTFSVIPIGEVAGPPATVDARTAAAK